MGLIFDDLSSNFHSFAYSDDGSTGMEVAIKMALRLWDVRTENSFINGADVLSRMSKDDSDDIGDHMKNVVVLTQKDCYHGERRMERLCIV